MGVGDAAIPGADQSVRPINAYVSLVTEHRDGEIDWPEGLGIGTLLHLGLGVLHNPAGIAILPAEPDQLIPRCIDQYPCAQWRIPMDMMRQG